MLFLLKRGPLSVKIVDELRKGPVEEVWDADELGKGPVEEVWDADEEAWGTDEVWR